MYCWLLLQIYLCCLWLLLCSRDTFKKQKCYIEHWRIRILLHSCSFFSEQNQHFTRWAWVNKQRLLQGGKSHIHFHYHTGFSWVPAPGFTCQLSWIFIRARAATNYQDGRKLVAFEQPINQRIIYLRALFGIVCASTTNQHWHSSYEPSELRHGIF